LPLFYDVNYASTTNSSAGTETTQLWVKTAAEQETLSLVGCYGSCRGGTAGGASIRIKHNTGTTASGGTAQTPAAKNLRYAVAAQSIWANGGTAITPGATLVTRMSIGVAQTGGMGGYIPITPQEAIQMQPNATNPVDLEFTNIANGSSVAMDMTAEFGEGV
jgi:hypothetical protein